MLALGAPTLVPLGCAVPSQTLLHLGEAEEHVFRDRAGKTKLPAETAAALQFCSLARPAPTVLAQPSHGVSHLQESSLLSGRLTKSCLTFPLLVPALLPI